MTIRKPNATDGPAVWQLIQDSPPLDLNSPYAYLLLCDHFSETCRVIDVKEKMMGFVSAYLLPADPETLFVWQIVIHPDLRGQGMARKLLMDLVKSPACRAVRRIDATIGPSNKASRSLFQSLAKELDAKYYEEVRYSREHFPPGQAHEEEVLFRIGPLGGEPKNT